MLRSKLSLLSIIGASLGSRIYTEKMLENVPSATMLSRAFAPRYDSHSASKQNKLSQKKRRIRARQMASVK